MPQFNLPKKHVSTVQLWASLLLIVLAFVFSLTPVITLDVFSNVKDSDLTETFEELDLDELLEELHLDAEFFEDYEELEISAPKLISSGMLFVKLIQAAADEDFEDFEDYLDSEKGEEALATALGLGLAIMNTLDFDVLMGDGEESGSDIAGAAIPMIFKAMIAMIGLFAVLGITIFLPFVFGFMALGSLIKALKNIKTPENAAPALASKLSGKIALPFTLMLFQCVIPGMTYGSGLAAIAVIVIIATVLNLAATRARTYEVEDFKYLNIVQGCSIVGIIGFLVFFFNIIKTGILNAFVSGDFFLCLVGALAAEELDYDAEMGFVVCGILMLVYLVVVLNAKDYIVKSTRRLSCAVKRDRVGFKKVFTDNHIVRAAFTLLAFIIPSYVLGQEYEVEDIFSEEIFSSEMAELFKSDELVFLDLSSKGERALSAALVGIILMIVAEVAIFVLKKVFCPNLDADKAEEVLIGQSPALETDSLIYFARKANKADAVEVADEAVDAEASEEVSEEAEEVSVSASEETAE